MNELTQRILFYLNHRAYDRMLLGAVLFSNQHGYLGETEHVRTLEKLINEQKRMQTKEEHL